MLPASWVVVGVHRGIDGANTPGCGLAAARPPSQVRLQPRCTHACTHLCHDPTRPCNRWWSFIVSSRLEGGGGWLVGRKDRVQQLLTRCGWGRKEVFHQDTRALYTLAGSPVAVTSATTYIYSNCTVSHPKFKYLTCLTLNIHHIDCD